VPLEHQQKINLSQVYAYKLLAQPQGKQSHLTFQTSYKRRVGVLLFQRTCRDWQKCVARNFQMLQTSRTKRIDSELSTTRAAAAATFDDICTKLTVVAMKRNKQHLAAVLSMEDSSGSITKICFIAIRKAAFKSCFHDFNVCVAVLKNTWYLFDRRIAAGLWTTQVWLPINNNLQSTTSRNLAVAWVQIHRNTTFKILRCFRFKQNIAFCQKVQFIFTVASPTRFLQFLRSHDNFGKMFNRKC